MSLTPNTTLRRLAKYNAVGALGMGFRFAVLVLLRELGGLGYLASTALAIEAAMLHNFSWHRWWTWRERCAGIPWRATALRLLQFQLSNGAVAMVTNLLVVRLLVGETGMHYLPANILATAASGAVNFLVSEHLIFRLSWLEMTAPAGRGRS